VAAGRQTALQPARRKKKQVEGEERSRAALSAETRCHAVGDVRRWYDVMPFGDVCTRHDAMAFGAVSFDRIFPAPRRR
jgi:hypothetical protein